MPSKPIDRRSIIQTGATMCGLCLCAQFPLNAFAGDKKIDPKDRNYCGYKCPKDCAFLEATLENDLEKKKEAWQEWKIVDRYGLEFDEEQAFCYGCKELDKPEGVVLSQCTVRQCAREKEFDCCIECDELTTCDKDLWKRFAAFHEQVVKLQEKYRAQA